MMAQSPRQAGAKSLQRGFTLLELVVAFTILALLAGVIYSALRVAIDSYTATQDRMEKHARERILTDFLKRQLGSIFPVVPEGGFLQEDQLAEADPTDARELLQTASSPLFLGTRRTVTFVTVAPFLHMRNPGLTVVTYGRAEDEWGNEYLGAMEVRFSGLDSFNYMASLPQGKPLPILEGIHEVRFSYYGQDLESGEFTWFEEWSGEDMGSIPRAVRVEFDDDRYITVPVNATEVGVRRGRRGGQLGITTVLQDRN